MAIYHLSASIIKRSAGRSVTAAAAYRAAAKIEDIKTGIIHDYGRKQGVDYSEIISPVSPNSNSSNQWLTNRAELWNKIEQVEKRKDAQLAREVTIAIPTELSKLDQIALVREYVQTNYVAAGMIADINLHHLDGDNPHAHILLTMRNLQTSPEGVVEFGLKNTDWNSKDLLLAQRKSWEEVANKYLAARGLDTRIDCRSLEEQGSPYIPQIHVGVHAMAMKRKGIATDRSEEFERIEAANNDIRARLEEAYQQEYTEPEPDLIQEDEENIADKDHKLAQSISDILDIKRSLSLDIGDYRVSRFTTDKRIKVYAGNQRILEFKLIDNQWRDILKYRCAPDTYEHFHQSTERTKIRIEQYNSENNELGKSIYSLLQENKNNELIYKPFKFRKEENKIKVLYKPPGYQHSISLEFNLINDKWEKLDKAKYPINQVSNDTLNRILQRIKNTNIEVEEEINIKQQINIIDTQSIIVLPKLESEEETEIEKLEPELSINTYHKLDQELGDNIMNCIDAYSQNTIITRHHRLSWNEASKSVEVKLKTETLKPPILTLKYTLDGWTTNEKDLELKREILKKVLEVNQEINDRQSQRSNEPKRHSRSR